MPDLSAAHKQALAEGRVQSNAVRRYLDALGQATGTSGGGDPEAIAAKLNDVVDQIANETDVIKRLSQIQRRLDLEQELVAAQQASRIDEAEAEFIEVAAAYSDRKGVSYTAWREIGVPAATLKAAGIARTRRASVE